MQLKLSNLIGALASTKDTQIHVYIFVPFSAEVNWLKESYRRGSVVDAMDVGTPKRVLEDIYRHLVFDNASLSERDKLAFKIARGGTVACSETY